MGRWKGVVIAAVALLVATPVSAWLIAERDLLDLSEAAGAAPGLPVSQWVRDSDGDKVDDRLASTGTASVIIAFEGPIGDAERAQLLAVPTLRLIHEWSIVHGAWATIDLPFARELGALPFVKHVEADPVLQPTLDVSTRALHAQDARAGNFANGTAFGFESRGVWRRDVVEGLQGVTGAGVLVALLDGGIDDRHPSLDDLDDDAATADPSKVALRLNAWAYAFLNFTVGLAQPVNTTYPYVVENPSGTVLPTECDIDPTGLYCSTARPLANGYLGLFTPDFGGGVCVPSVAVYWPYCVGGPACPPPLYSPCLPASPTGEVELPNWPLGSTVSQPSVGIPSILPGGTVQDAAGGRDLFSPPPFTTLAHATAMANAIAGTGDATGTPSAVTLAEPFAYAGVAPGARLVDVNLFIGVDAECMPASPAAAPAAAKDALAENACPAGPRGSSRGLQVGSANAAFAQTGSTLITGAEMVQRYNSENSADADHPIIPVAVIPLLDIQSCDQYSYDTLVEAAIDELALSNVTVITSVGQDQTGICVPANVPRTISIGASDGRRTITMDDDVAWPDMSVPNLDTQERMPKPDLTTPGVAIWTARSSPNDFYEVTGSSIAAAQAAGVAALMIEAGNHSLQGIDLKTRLINTANPDAAPNLDPAGYRDVGGGGEPGDGERDGNNRTGWDRTFGWIDARAAVCTLMTCPMPWEGLDTAILPDPETPFPLSAHVGERVTFEGRAVVDDARAGSFWLDRQAKEHYAPLGGVGPGVAVNFAFANAYTTSIEGLTPVATATTGPNGTFALNVDIDKDKRPGATFCAMWVSELPQDPDRDGLLPSLGLPCTLSIFSGTTLDLDLCGEGEECDPTHKVVSFLNDPSVDFLRGVVRLTDGSGKVLEDQLLRVEWPGAAETHQDLYLRTAQNTGEALVKLPLGGRAGTFLLNISFVPPGGSFLDPAFLTLPVTVSVGTRADIQLVGREPGSVLLNDGTTLPVGVAGTLQTFLGQPIKGATVELAVEGRLSRSLGTARTDEAGRFSLGLDARPLQSGTYGLLVRYTGERAPSGPGYTLLPTTSYRIPFTVVVQPAIAVVPAGVAHRGEPMTVNGTVYNPFGRPIGNETVTATWIGGSSLTQSVRTDRGGRFTFTRELPDDESLGQLLLRVQYAGSPELAPAEASRSIDVDGRSFLSVFPGEVRRGATARLQGLLYDDTGRPLVGQRVAVLWGSAAAGNATTDALGHYAIDYPVPGDERPGPVTVRVAYAGRTFMEPSNAQGTVGVLAPTDLVVDAGNRSANQVLEFTTRLLDDQGRVVTDPQEIEVYIAPPRDGDSEKVTLLTPLDLSNALAPELRLSHAYRLATGFGVSDGARVQVSLDAGRSWTTVTPRTGYPDQQAAVFDGPAFNGETSGWFPQRVDLSAYANETDVRLRWRTATSPLNNDLRIAVDNVAVRDGDRTVFTDDFERFGSKAGSNAYWSVPADGGFVVGRESFTAGRAGVLATNLAGSYPANARLGAFGPNMTLAPADATVIGVRYRLDVGNREDYATVSLRYGGASHLLSPLGEPGYTQMPETNGKWRWLFYELPVAARGKVASLQLSFQSDGLLGGDGLQVDEVRVLSAPGVARVPITADPSVWAFSRFNAGLPRDLDTYVPSQDSKPYTAPPQLTLRRLDGPVLLGLAQMPFRVKFFDESYDRLTVYPDGVLALGDTLGQDPSALCRARPADQPCHLAEVPGFPAPLVAPAWDNALDTRNAFLAYATVGQAPNRQLILEWRGLAAPEAAPGSASARFQAILHEGGDIEFRYGSLFFGGDRHDLGANAIVGVGQPGLPGHTVEASARDAVLSDNLRLFLARVKAAPVAEVRDACGPACQVLGPNPAGTYAPAATSEAILDSGIDLSKSGEAYLVVRQFVDVGRGDTVLVQARPFGSNSWRNLPVLMGGESAVGGALLPDRSGAWSTAVYDLSSLVGQRVKVRLQVNADGAGQDVGILVREMTALVLPRTGDGPVSDTFNSYLDTSRGGDTWWTSRRAGDTDASPAWRLQAHDGAQPTDLGQSFLGLGDGGALDASTQFLLATPSFDLSNAKDPVLEWWQLFTPTDDLDGTVLEVSTDGGVSYQPIRPEGDGYDDIVPTLNGAGWSGPQFGFQTDTFDLTPYTGQDVRLRLDLGLGASPFSGTWILDELSIVDRLGGGATYVTEGGNFATTRWDRDANWTALPQASAVGRHRDGIPVTSVLSVTGATTQHRIALPESTARGPVQATLLYRGASSTFGGAVSSAQLLLQAESQFSGVRVGNDLDNKSYLLRGRTFTLEGTLRSLDGNALAGRLVQVELGGVPIGSARSGTDGRFRTTPLLVSPDAQLGRSTLKLTYGGDAQDHVQGASEELTVAIKGMAHLEVEKQVAKGDRLQVTVRIVDDRGAPLGSTAAIVGIEGESGEVSVITDPDGRATFTTKVPEAKRSEVAFEVRALGSQDVLGARLGQATVVPAAPDAPVWPYVLAGSLLLLAAIVAAVVLLLRRRRVEDLAAALAEELQRTRYALSTGDAVRESIFGLYRAFLQALARAGRPVPPTQTADELARTLGDVFGPAQRGDLLRLTGLFSRARYSEDAMGEDERREALGCVQRLEQALAPAPAPTPQPDAAAPAPAAAKGGKA